MAFGIDQSILRMQQIAATKTLLPAEAKALLPQIQALRSEVERAFEETAETSPLARLPSKQRATYEHFFDLVYECSTNRSAAKALINKILLKIVP
jgi:molecular chaperone HtpG